MKKIITLGIILIALLVAVAVTPGLILHNEKLIALPPAGPLAGPISQALSSSDGKSLPVAGKDYTLADTHYFDNGSWVATSIIAQAGGLQNGYIVLRQQSGVYQVVLGPGTAFARSYTQTMPADVTQYLNTLGALYDTGGQ